MTDRLISIAVIIVLVIVAVALTRIVRKLSKRLAIHERNEREQILVDVLRRMQGAVRTFVSESSTGLTVSDITTNEFYFTFVAKRGQVPVITVHVPSPDCSRTAKIQVQCGTGNTAKLYDATNVGATKALGDVASFLGRFKDEVQAVA